MTTAKKFHIGKNGPAPCKAEKRACRLDPSKHGSEEEVTALWEKEQEELYDPLASNRKADIDDNEALVKTKQTLANKDNYKAAKKSVIYGDSERDIAMKLALSNLTPFAYTPIDSLDESWSSGGFSTVRRYVLEDGSVGYFKPFSLNSEDEGVFEDYGTTSIGASINEVNANRLAQSMGGGFAKLVPETVLREIDGNIGTLQREVKIYNMPVDHRDSNIVDDYKKAAIVDFIMGNLDRHSSNYLFESVKGKPRIRLIDNSFSFPSEENPGRYNQSDFAEDCGLLIGWNYVGEIAQNEDDYSKFDKTNGRECSYLALSDQDKKAIEKASESLQKWANDGTIDKNRAQSAIDRANELLSKGRLVNYLHYRDEGNA